MDIEYLLFLQNFRNSINDALTPFMEDISFFAISYIVLLIAFVYWCIDKKKGLFIFFALKISHLINAVVKLTACVYRPWIKDARVLPAGNAIETATGYSFPSGHTMMSVPIYGSLAIFTKKRKLLCSLFIILALLTMFSRNYLGVHTPQDVLVGCVMGLLSIYITGRVFEYIERYPEKENKVMAIIFVLALAGFAYVNLKSYPMDYVNGKLLVNPNKMTVDSWGDIGGLMALIIMYCIEKRFVNFSSTGLNPKGIILGIIGLIPLALMIYGLKPIIVSFTGAHLGRLLYETALTFYIILLWPMVLKIFYGKKAD